MAPAFRSPLLLPAWGLAFLGSGVLGWVGARERDLTARANPPRTDQTAAVEKTGAAGAAGVQTFEEAADAMDESDYRHALHLAQAAAALDREQVLAALEREHAREAGNVNARAEATVEALLARFAELDGRAATLWLLQTYPHDQPEAWMRATLGTGSCATARRPWLGRRECLNVDCVTTSTAPCSTN